MLRSAAGHRCDIAIWAGANPRTATFSQGLSADQLCDAVAQRALVVVCQTAERFADELGLHGEQDRLDDAGHQQAGGADVGDGDVSEPRRALVLADTEIDCPVLHGPVLHGVANGVQR